MKRPKNHIVPPPPPATPKYEPPPRPNPAMGRDLVPDERRAAQVAAYQAVGGTAIRGATTVTRDQADHIGRTYGTDRSRR